MPKPLILFITIFFAGTMLAPAAYTIEVQSPYGEIPCLRPPCESLTSETGFLNYISRFYSFGIAFGGFLAVGMIAAGAIYMAISGLSPDKQNEGKNMILSAIFGLILLLVSYMLLYTINPRLVNLEISSVDEVPAQNLQTEPPTVHQCSPSVWNGCENAIEITSKETIDVPYCGKHSYNCAKDDIIYTKKTTIEPGGSYWKYPYYSKKGGNIEACVVYAYREKPKDKIQKAKLAGLKPCQPPVQ